MNKIAGPKKPGDETGRSPGKARPAGILPQAIVAAVAVGVTAWILSQSLFAQSVPQPVLSIAPSGTNQVLITITNGVSTANYELYYTLGLEGPPTYEWNLLVEGDVGETNFLVDVEGVNRTFFRAASNTDFDGDGVPNYKDADPFDPNVGQLTVIIYSPANGSTIGN
jgi:hypothetical protein